jgi:hypothetical protein
MHLKAALSRGLVLSVLLLAALATAPWAATLISSHHGTICKNTSSWADSRIVYEATGIHINNYNSENGEIWVVCPLTRNTMNKNGAYVYVDVTHLAT